jgi:hypothetical protein
VPEACARKAHANLRLFVNNFIAEEGRALEERDLIISLVSQIINSDRWQRILKE